MSDADALIDKLIDIRDYKTGNGFDLDEAEVKIIADEIERLRSIEAEARFLVDRLRAYEANSTQDDDSVREWCGHVTPPLARLQGLLWSSQ